MGVTVPLYSRGKVCKGPTWDADKATKARAARSLAVCTPTERAMVVTPHHAGRSSGTGFIPGAAKAKASDLKRHADTSQKVPRTSGRLRRKARFVAHAHAHHRRRLGHDTPHRMECQGKENQRPCENPTSGGSFLHPNSAQPQTVCDGFSRRYPHLPSLSSWLHWRQRKQGKGNRRRTAWWRGGGGKQPWRFQWRG